VGAPFWAACCSHTVCGAQFAAQSPPHTVCPMCSRAPPAKQSPEGAPKCGPRVELHRQPASLGLSRASTWLAYLRATCGRLSRRIGRNGRRLLSAGPPESGPLSAGRPQVNAPVWKLFFRVQGVGWQIGRSADCLRRHQPRAKTLSRLQVNEDAPRRRCTKAALPAKLGPRRARASSASQSRGVSRSQSFTCECSALISAPEGVLSFLRGR